MDPLSALIADEKIPVGRWGKMAFDATARNFGWAFDALSSNLRSFLDGVIDLLVTLPPVLSILVISGLAYVLQRSLWLAIGSAAGLLFILNQGLWDETLQTLVLVVSAAFASMAIGVPIGIWAAHRPRAYAVLQPVLDLMQTMPTFVYLIPVLILFGLGIAPGLIVTVIFAAPAPIRLTYLGMRAVPAPLLEAGRAFGATKSQLLWKVELPSAAPTIMAGLTQCIMLCLSMVVIAALIGADGLGKPVVRALNTVNVPLGLEAGLAIVILAIILDRISRLPERKRKP